MMYMWHRARPAREVAGIVRMRCLPLILIAVRTGHRAGLAVRKSVPEPLSISAGHLPFLAGRAGPWPCRVADHLATQSAFSSKQALMRPRPTGAPAVSFPLAAKDSSRLTEARLRHLAAT